jgi:hypothetical protein
MKPVGLDARLKPCVTLDKWRGVELALAAERRYVSPRLGTTKNADSHLSQQLVDRDRS